MSEAEVVTRRRDVHVMSIAQVSKATGVPESTLRRWCGDGELDAFKAGHWWMVWSDELPRIREKYRGNKVVSQEFLQFSAHVARARDLLKGCRHPTQNVIEARDLLSHALDEISTSVGIVSGTFV